MQNNPNTPAGQGHHRLPPDPERVRDRIIVAVLAFVCSLSVASLGLVGYSVGDVVTERLAEHTLAVQMQTKAVSELVEAQRLSVSLLEQQLLEQRVIEALLREPAPTIIMVQGKDGEWSSVMSDDGPTANQVTTAALRGIDWSEVDRKNDQVASLSTTVIEALDSDLASGEQLVEYQQNLMVRNGDSSNVMCVGASTGWAQACSAATMTCRAGASTDGIPVYPGEKVSLRFLGTERPCILGAAAISTYDITRITYRGSTR